MRVTVRVRGLQLLAATALVLASCGGEDNAQTCDQVLDDPAFHGDGEVIGQFDAGGVGRSCTLAISPEAASTIGVDVCAATPYVAVKVDGDDWTVDDAQTAKLNTENC